jgi:hypothetical protein
LHKYERYPYTSQKAEAGNKDILCLYPSCLSDEYYIHFVLSDRMVRIVDTISLDAGDSLHSLWFVHLIAFAVLWGTLPETLAPEEFAVGN